MSRQCGGEESGCDVREEREMHEEGMKEELADKHNR